ncbi:hypothetical protein TCAL_15971 [Tigriopus californicus]|uniref:Uncharacterized protein n=1 Tax=Tigriopus californicus TaxID=6832 RepID=A0A553PHH4_TIGCA|nr:hypothetical protein TCAL_15971 [Tigriopus californicus]
MAKQLELLQRHGGLAVGLRGLLQMPDGPHHREKDGAATQEIHQGEHLAPRVVVGLALLGLLHNDVGHVSQHLQGQDDHEHALLLVREDVLDEDPAGTDQDDGEEQEGALEEMRYVEEDGPTFDVVAVLFDLLVVDAVKQERERFQVHQSRHDPVNAEHALTPVLAQDEHPEAARQEEQHGHENVERGQRHLTGRQIAVAVFLLNVHREIDPQLGPAIPGTRPSGPTLWYKGKLKGEQGPPAGAGVVSAEDERFWGGADSGASDFRAGQSEGNMPESEKVCPPKAALARMACTGWTLGKMLSDWMFSEQDTSVRLVWKLRRKRTKPLPLGQPWPALGR